MSVVDCRQVKQQEMIERYLLGRLDESEQEALEQHYFECPHCLEELETYRALREELAHRAAEIRAEPAPVRTARTWLWVPALAGVAAAVALAVWLWPRPTSTGPTTPIAQAPATVSVDAALVELAKVEPPAYTPVILRGSTDQARRRFHEAMTHYENGDCAAVLPSLRQAVRLNPTLPEANFYLGACCLLTGADEEAVASLKKTVAFGDTPYLEDALFYLAKAYLRARDLAAARRELEGVVRLKGDRENAARRLLQQLAAVGGNSP
jgi:tetratricopeptide (TPR) repeat protein